jgi:uncharacterized membrane protein YagU involved in acid resistance
VSARTFWIAALVGGAIAATLDILYAFAWQGLSNRGPVWVLQSIASGWMGRAAFKGGMVAAAVGLASHYGISIAAAALYGLAVRGSPWIRAHWIVGGIAFGILVYLFMNFVVIPLSAAPFGPQWTAGAFIQGFISHAVVFGLPIAWVWHRGSRT